MKKQIEKIIIVSTYAGEGKSFRPVWHVFIGERFIAQYSNLNSARSAFPGAELDLE